MVDEEPKPLQPTDELIERLEKELEKLTGEKVEKEKSNNITDDLLRKINKLSEMIDVEDDSEESTTEEKHEEIEEKPIVIPTPNKKRIIYKRRDGGSNTRIDRI